MKKLLISCVTVLALLGSISTASAHGWRGGYGGCSHGGGCVPFAAGAVTGAVIANSYSNYYRPVPTYFGSPTVYYYPQQHSVAYCPENGLYYPQTQACPSGWQRVAF